MIVHKTENWKNQNLLTVLETFWFSYSFKSFYNKIVFIRFHNFLRGCFDNILWVSIIFFVGIWRKNFFSMILFQFIVKFWINSCLRDLKVQALQNWPFNFKEFFSWVIFLSDQTDLVNSNWIYLIVFCSENHKWSRRKLKILKEWSKVFLNEYISNFNG